MKRHIPRNSQLTTPLRRRSTEQENRLYGDFLALLLTEVVARSKQTRLQRWTRHARFSFPKIIDEFDFSLPLAPGQSLLGSYLYLTEGRSLIRYSKTGGKKLAWLWPPAIAPFRIALTAPVPPPRNGPGISPTASLPTFW